MRAANGVSNMALAHEIAVDHDFKLEKYKAPDNRLVFIITLFFIT